MTKKESDNTSVSNKFEKARIIGARALQLAMGAPPLVNDVGTINAVVLANIEYEKLVIPLKVVRSAKVLAG